MDRRRHEVVAERVHRYERSQLARVAEVVGEHAAGQRRARRRLAREHVDLAAGDLLADEREREPREVRAAADAADDDVRERAGHLHLRDRLLPDHRLVQEHVVEDAAERVRRVVALRRVLHGFRDRDPEAAGRVGELLEDRTAALRVARRARHDLRAPELDHRAPERLLVVRDANHVDLALEPDQLARERKRTPPLAGASLRREARTALLLVVVRLRDGGVRLVAPWRADALVLVEDPRPRPRGLLEPVCPVERRRAPEAVDVEDLLGNRDLCVLADLLEHQRHREERREVVGPDRLAGARVQDGLRRRRHVGGDVVPAPGDLRLLEQELRLLHGSDHNENRGFRPTGVRCADRWYKRGMTGSSSRILTALGLVLAAVAVPAAGAAGRETGSVVVRLVTDPSPAGTSWSYSGLGASFRLGSAGSQRVVQGLQPGTYSVLEAAVVAGAPRTLTGIACSDPSKDTKVDLGGSAATVALAAGETVTCTFTHRALGPRPAASAVQLARRFAPLLRLASGERYRPLRLEDYLTRSVLRTGSPPSGAISQSKPTLFSLPTTPAASYLDVRDAQPNANSALYPAIEQ